MIRSRWGGNCGTSEDLRRRLGVSVCCVRNATVSVPVFPKVALVLGYGNRSGDWADDVHLRVPIDHQLRKQQMI